MSTLFQASTQWATRPADQRFTSLTALNRFAQGVRARSNGRVVSSRKLQAVPGKGDYRALQVCGPNGVPVDVTHWSFGQLANRAGAPAGYLRTLPGALAADNINYGLQVIRDVEDIGVLLSADDNGGQAVLRAVTGPNYGRIWNHQVTQALVDRFGDGITGDFRVPGEFGRAVEVTNANTTLYASDRDMFVFLADEEHRIELPGRRNGETGTLARGFFVSNSEVGSGTLSVSTFLFDYVCCNRIVWGAQQYKQINIRHTASAPDKWVEQVAPALEQYALSSTTSITEALQLAQRSKVDRIEEFLAQRFTRPQVEGIKRAHLADEGRPMETLWDVATGITAFARDITWQDDRVAIEREAGKVLDLVAA
ncbi:MAG: Synechococcus virus [Pseudomonadota bacterium]